ncbi:MAG TPA: GxxExxY protein [Blastocatellia bacterium]|nr:GxxExxY protein [Blastocatellia bacterium]
MRLIFEEQTRILRRCIFDVHNEVGVGYPEEAYHQAFLACCASRRIPALSRQSGRLQHRDVVVHTFQYDLLAFGEIILELKALPAGFARENFVQILSYLKFWRKPLGLLVNFGQEKAKIERLPFHEKDLVISEDYTHIPPNLSPADKRLLREIREGVLAVAKTHGIGYGDTVCAKLLQAEWEHRHLSVHSQLMSPVQFEGALIGTFPVDGMLVGERVLCYVTALKDEIGPFEIGKTQSYLRAMSIPVGIVINFGRQALQVRAVCPPNR